MERIDIAAKLETADLCSREPTKSSKELKKVLRFLEVTSKKKVRLALKPAPCRKDVPQEELRRLALEALARLDETKPWFSGIFQAVFDSFGSSSDGALDPVIALVDSCIEMCSVTNVSSKGYAALHSVMLRVKAAADNGYCIKPVIPALMDIVARCAAASADCMDHLCTMSFFHEGFGPEGVVSIRLDHVINQRMTVLVLTWLHGVSSATPDSVYLMALAKPAKNLPKLRALMLSLRAVDDLDEVVEAALRFLRSGGIIAKQDIRMDDGRAEHVQLLMAAKHDVMACSLVLCREKMLQHGCLPVVARVEQALLTLP